MTSWISWYPKPRAGNFPLPSPIIPLQNSVQQSAAGERYVNSEEELRQAILAVASTFRVGGAKLATSGGGNIVIAKSFTVSDVVTIPPKCSFLTIRALPGAGIFPVEADQGVLFDIQAQFFTLEKVIALYQVDEGNNPTAWFNVFAQASQGAAVDGVTIKPINMRIHDSIAYCDQLFYDATTDDAGYAYLVGCYSTEANPSHTACVRFNSRGQQVVQCILSDGGGDAVTIDTNASRCVVERCDLSGGDVTSTASGGGSRVWNNERTGTLTLHGDDSSGGNT